MTSRSIKPSFSSLSPGLCPHSQLGKFILAFIRHPYNTGKEFEHYDDNLEHSIWLNLMHTRFKLLHKLLSNEGVIFVNLDDSEAAYCKVLMDEIFGRSNYLNEIIVSINESFGFKSTSDMIFKQANHILFYAKNRSEFEIDKASLLIEREYDTQYKWVFFNTEAEESD